MMQDEKHNSQYNKINLFKMKQSNKDIINIRFNISQVQSQEFNQNYAQQPIVQIENINSQLLKGQNYDLQKYFLCGILGLFEIWSLLSIIGFGYYYYDSGFDVIEIFFLCAVFLVICLVLGKLKKLRKPCISVAFYFASIFIYAIIIDTMRYSVYYKWDYYYYDSYYYYIEMFFIMIVSNFLITLFLIVKNQVMYFLYLIFICNLIGVVLSGYWIYLWFSWIQLYYFSMILYVFDKILKGKFELEKNQIFVAVLATYLNILFPMFV